MFRRQIPSSKSQIPTYSQAPIPKTIPKAIPDRVGRGGGLGICLGLCLGFGSWEWLGMWSLELGICRYAIHHNRYVAYRNGGTGAITCAGRIQVALADQTFVSCGNHCGRLCQPSPPGSREDVTASRILGSAGSAPLWKLASQAMPSGGTAI